jgi:hypothetical protein
MMSTEQLWTSECWVLVIGKDNLAGYQAKCPYCSWHDLTSFRNRETAVDMTRDHIKDKHPTPVRPEAKVRTRESLQKQIERAQAELDRLDALPDEPAGGDVLVIWFTKRFPGGDKDYTYAAVKAENGLWYTTGPRNPKGRTWADLVDWIYEPGAFSNVWVVTEVEPLT